MTTQQPYASREESASVIVGDARSPEEKLVDKMIADAGANEQGAEYVPILYRVAAQLAAQRNHFQTLAQDSCAVIIRTACELGDVMAQRDDLLSALDALVGRNALQSLCRQEGRDALGRVRGTWGVDAEDKARAALAKHQPPAAPAAPTHHHG